MSVIANVAPDGEDWIARKLRDLEQQIAELRSARTLNAATIDGGPGSGIRTADFDGTSFANPGSAGNYFGADGAVLNALNLRPGSVSNDALANPAAFISVDQRNAGTFTVGATTFLSQTITPPAGFSRCFVHVIGVANLQVPGSSTNVIARITSSSGAISSDTSTTTVPASAFGNASSTLAQTITGLAGSFTLSLVAGVSIAVPAFSCYGSLTGLVVFLR